MNRECWALKQRYPYYLNGKLRKSECLGWDILNSGNIRQKAGCRPLQPFKATEFDVYGKKDFDGPEQGMGII